MRKCYVVQCVRDVDRCTVGLGAVGRYLKGQYVTGTGRPTNNFDAAWVYGLSDQFPFDDKLDGVRVSDYFVKIGVKISLDDSPDISCPVEAA